MFHQLHWNWQHIWRYPVKDGLRFVYREALKGIALGFGAGIGFGMVFFIYAVVRG